MELPAACNSVGAHGLAPTLHDSVLWLITGTVPMTWGQADAFPALQYLDMQSCQLTGPLPSAWPSSLQHLDVSFNSLHGSLPAELSSMPQLQELILSVNALTGVLPAEWGQSTAFPQLFDLQVAATNISGSLPASWGGEGAFQSLQVLYLNNNSRLIGSLPDSWAASGAFPELQTLNLASSPFTGTIPASWPWKDAFPQLQVLNLDNTYLRGSLPSFLNPNLKVISMYNCYFNSTLDMFWNSSAPLQVVSLAINFLSGSLPAVTGALSQLTFLDLSINQLTGTVPLSWLQAGNIVSHITVLNLGSVWDASQAQTNWRQQLCLNRELYDTDVTGRQAALVPSLLSNLSGFTQYTEDTNALFADFSGLLQTNDAIDLLSLGMLVGGTSNQLVSVSSICANNGSWKVLLIVWLVFGACCLLVLAVYGGAQKLHGKHASLPASLWPCIMPMQAMLSVICEAFWGLGGLAFYYYDLVTSLIVLAQVWGTWPGALLAAIFFVHFTITGVAVAFHGLNRLVHLSKDEVWSPGRYTIIAVTSLAAGPVMIPVVLVLDTCAFVAQVLQCIRVFARLSSFQWLRPGYIVAFKVHRCLHALNYMGMSWVDLENYEGMHNLIAACLQSLPTVILNSVVFCLGNKPNHGIFLSTGLFVTAIVASCLAILKCLVVILWQASRGNTNPFRHFAALVFGKTLAGHHTEAPGTVPLSSRRIEMLIQQYHSSFSPPLGSPEPASHQAGHPA